MTNTLPFEASRSLEHEGLATVLSLPFADLRLQFSPENARTLSRIGESLQTVYGRA